MSSFTVQATDSSSPALSVTQAYTLTVALGLSPKALAKATAGTEYFQAFSAQGGTAPYSFSLASGTLPPGLSLIALTGELSGTPTTAGTYIFTIQATDSSSPANTGMRKYTMKVPLGLSPASPLPKGDIGQPYSTTISAIGGSGSYTFALTGGTLPTGLTLDSSTGTISGTPTATQTKSFTIGVTDTVTGLTGSMKYSLHV